MANLVKCAECGGMVSTEAGRCPHCGGHTKPFTCDACGKPGKQSDCAQRVRMHTACYIQHCLSADIIADACPTCKAPYNYAGVTPHPDTVSIIYYSQPCHNCGQLIAHQHCYVCNRPVAEHSAIRGAAKPRQCHDAGYMHISCARLVIDNPRRLCLCDRCGRQVTGDNRSWWAGLMGKDRHARC